MPTHSRQRTNRQRDTYSQICLGHRSVNVTQRAYSCSAPCNRPGTCRADLLVSLLRISFLHHDSGHPSELGPRLTEQAGGPVGRGGHHRPRTPSRRRGRAHSGHITRSSWPELGAAPPPLFRPRSVRRRSAPPNDANRRAVKSQLSGMVAGPAAGANSSSSTPTGLEVRHSGNSTATASRYH
jgi:hypothetical protein